MSSCSRPRSRSEAPRGPAGGWLLAAMVLLAAVPARAAGHGPEHGSYAVIVSAAVPVNDVTLNELSQLLLGDRRFWRVGAPVVVFVPPAGSPARRFLLAHAFHM